MPEDHINLRSLRTRFTTFIEEITLDHRVLDTLRLEDQFIPLETELWDYKRTIPSDSAAIAKTLLHIVSFHNTFGGYIIYGLEERKDLGKVLPAGIDSVGRRNANDLRHMLRARLRTITGDNIALTYHELAYTIAGADHLFGLLHIPKRANNASPVFFGKTSQEQDDGVPVFIRDTAYLRLQDTCIPATTKDHYQMLYSERASPFLLVSDYAAPTPGVTDHNLPDRNFICSHFFGRDTIIQSLWHWLGDPFVYVKALAGDGGKGKTSIAYEFAREVCRTRPYHLEKIIWLTAKTRQFAPDLDAYVNMPETHYADTSSLLQALCRELAILDSETFEASQPLLKKLLRAALALVPTLVVIDDLDSVTPVEQRLIVEAVSQLAGPNARFLLTTRMNWLLGPSACINVGGLAEPEYSEYVRDLAARLRLAALTAKELRNLRTATDGSPLYTESLLRLCRTGDPLYKAINDWKGALGEDVRKAALKKEIDALSLESRRVLLACALLREASATELRQVTGYRDERMLACIAELEALFLVSAPGFIKTERRFTVSNTTALLVLSERDLLISDANALERLVRRLRERGREDAGGGVDHERVGAAISQVSALWRSGAIDAAVETIEAALREQRDNADLLFVRGRCYLNKRDGRSLNVARRAFKKAYECGQRKELLFHFWYESEMTAKDPAAAIEVADRALQCCEERQRVQWLRNRAEARFAHAQGLGDSRNGDAALAELRGCGADLSAAVEAAPDTQRAVLRERQFAVNDEAYAMSVGTGDVPDLRRAFNVIVECIGEGDRRPANYVRLLDCAERIVGVWEAPLSAAQSNLANQMVRSISRVLPIIRASPDSGKRELADRRFDRLRRRLAEEMNSEALISSGSAGGSGEPLLEVGEMVEYLGNDAPGIYRIEVHDGDNTFTIAAEDLKIVSIERSLLRRCWRYTAKDGYPPLGQEVVASYRLEGTPYTFPGRWDGRWWRSSLDPDFSDRAGVVYAWRPFLAGEQADVMLSRAPAPLPKRQER